MKTEKLVAPAELLEGLLALKEVVDRLGHTTVTLTTSIEASVEQAMKEGSLSKLPPGFRQDLAPVRMASFLAQQMRALACTVTPAIEAAAHLTKIMAERAATAPRPMRRDFMNDAEHASALSGWKRLRDDVKKTAKAAKKEAKPR